MKSHLTQKDKIINNDLSREEKLKIFSYTLTRRNSDVKRLQWRFKVEDLEGSKVHEEYFGIK